MLLRLPVRKAPPRSGAAAVEFAIVALIFFMFFFAIFEYARYIFFQNLLNTAAREAARFAVVSSATGTSSTTYNGSVVSTAQMTSVVQQYADSFLAGMGHNNLVGYPASPAPLPAISTGYFNNFIQVYYLQQTTTPSTVNAQWYNAPAGNLIGVSFATPTPNGTNTGYTPLNYLPVTPALIFLPSTMPITGTCLMFCEAT
jgi:hypothetical protein